MNLLESNFIWFAIICQGDFIFLCVTSMSDLQIKYEFASYLH